MTNGHDAEMAYSDAYWVGWLASGINRTLRTLRDEDKAYANEIARRELAHDLAEFLRSPCTTDALRKDLGGMKQ
jgi:hypothetical protein